MPTRAMYIIVFALLRMLLGRNLRHVDLTIRAGTNIPLFYSLAFGQLTRLVPGDSLTSRALRTTFLRFLHSFLHS